MVNETAPGPVFCVFRPKIPRTFYFKLTEQSSRKKLAVSGFEPEKVRLLYPAPQKTALLSTTTRVRFFHISGQKRLKTEKIKQNRASERSSRLPRSPVFVSGSEKRLKILVYFLSVLALQRLFHYENVTGFEPQKSDAIFTT